jgi:starch-binding outer membrane protein, SusD/RagB family
MRTIHKLYLYIISAAFLWNTTGCNKFIEEDNLGGRTAETYYNTKQGFEDLVKSNYSNLRPIANYYALYCLGTDIYSSYNTDDVSALNLYNNSLNSALGDVDSYWIQLYYAIGIANTTLYWSDEVEGLDTATLKIRIGEAKALRAYYYFLLAETFGDAPLVLIPATEPRSDYTRAPEKDLYTQMITDLTEAAAVLPKTSTEFGRVTRGMAQHLLSKVYLTRAYKTYGEGSSDYTQAATLADSVINSGTYSLQTTFSTLFDPTITNFQVNSEVIFSVQYSTTTATNVWWYATAPSTTYTGNSLHGLFITYPSITAFGRSALYGKSTGPSAPDPYFFSLFDKTRDSRYLATAWNAMLAQVASTPFSVGDTVIFYPDTAWSETQKAAVEYYVINPDEYRNTFFTLTRAYPSFKKFREVDVAFGDNGGTRDTYLFRLAETYLVAAEAYLQLGNTSKALEYYNAIRARGAKTGTNPATGIAYSTEMQVSTLTIDDILDERARELAGEEFRWYELKRTGKLIERTMAHNDETKAANTTIDNHFLLRPIPQSQIDLSSVGLAQNPGYTE